MKTLSGIEITLQKGKATKSVEDFTEADWKALSDKIVARVTRLAKRYGNEVVTLETVLRKRALERENNQ